MKSKLSVLFLIPVYLFTFVGGVDQALVETTTATEVTQETILVVTAPTVETTESPTENVIPETTKAPLIPIVKKQHDAEPIAADPVATVPKVTEPPTEIDEPVARLRSLGTFRLTAYCSCQKCCDSYALDRPIDENGDEIVYGSIGVRLKAGVSIAVDPRVIPYGTQVVINGHTYTAHDTGGSIKGNRIDVYFDDHQEAWNFGTQYVEVFVND